MQAKTLGLIFFALGAFILHFTTTLGFLWLLVGLPSPFPPPETIATSGGTAAVLGGFITPTGALLMVIGGYVYGRKVRR